MSDVEFSDHLYLPLALPEELRECVYYDLENALPSLRWRVSSPTAPVRVMGDQVGARYASPTSVMSLK